MLNNKKQISLPNSNKCSKKPLLFNLPVIPSAFLRFSASANSTQDLDFFNDFNFLIANVRKSLNSNQLRPFFPFIISLTQRQRRKRRKALRVINRILKNLSRKQGAARFSILFSIARLRRVLFHYYPKGLYLSRNFKNYRHFHRSKDSFRPFSECSKSLFSTFKLSIFPRRFESFFIFKRFKDKQFESKKHFVKIKKHLKFVVWLSKLRRPLRGPILRVRRLRSRKSFSIFHRKKNRRKRNTASTRKAKSNTSNKMPISRKGRNYFYLPRKEKRHGVLVTFLGKKAFLLKKLVKFKTSKSNFLSGKEKSKLFKSRMVLKDVFLNKNNKQKLEKSTTNCFNDRKAFKRAFNAKLKKSKVKYLQQSFTKKYRHKIFFSNKHVIKKQMNTTDSCKPRSYFSLRRFFFSRTATLFKKKLKLKITVL